MPKKYTSDSFVKNGGTSAQFLKADGSVDITAYANIIHTHTKSQITDFAHTHPISEIVNLQSSLNGKQNLLPQNQIDAFDNATSPSAANPFLTSSDVVGGLPTGQIPSGRNAQITPFEVVSATFASVDNIQASVTLASAVPVYGIITFEIDQTGGGSDAVVEFKLTINGQESRVVRVDMNSKSSEVGSINFRTASTLPIGVHTMTLQGRKVSGGKSVFVNNSHLFVQAQQAPKGEDGVGLQPGGNTGEVLFKNSNASYDASWRGISKSDITNLINPMTVSVSSPQIVDKTWFGTQAQYTAIPTPDPNTLYIY
jgi:hypothetical protein